MPLVHDRCLCLRKTEYSETSQILTLLAREHGITRVIAKGAHRRTKAGASKFDGGIDLLDVGEAVFSHDLARDLPPLTEWSLREGHLALRKNLRGIYLGLYSAELVSRLIEEHDPHPQLFDRLEATLPELASSRREEAFLAFQLDLLRESGYLAELFACVCCGTAMDDRAPCYFSAARGGVVCRNCEHTTTDRATLDPRLLRLLQTISRLPRANGSPQRLPQLTRHQTDPINRIFANQIQHTLGRGLRLPKYVLG
ncbi:MAG TPA: DNA repair protein RecO [Tepidisphaeraceae bacterium]|jgi:DNA repair protein RecO (recombination protein O)|nr:DNA repair protein RecO [Tepidisphaeraceae bacterium]